MILSRLDEFVGRLSEIRGNATNFCESHLLAEIMIATRFARGCVNAVMVEILVQRQNTQGRNPSALRTGEGSGVVTLQAG